MQNENTKFIPRTQMQAILDNAPQGVDKNALINKFVSTGFKVEGVNDKPEPNIAQTIAGSLIKAPTDLIGAGFAGAGALGSFAGKKLAGQDTTLSQEYTNQTQQVQESGANAIMQPITGEQIRPAQNLEQLTGDVLQTGALVAPVSTIPKAAASGAALLGGAAMSDNESAMEVAKQAVIGGALGGSIAAIIPGLAKLASYSKTLEKEIQTSLSKGYKSDEVASGILQRQLKLNPITGNNEFKKLSGGMLPGDYLVQKGIFDTREEAVNKLAQDWLKSYNLKKDTLKLLPDQYTFNPVNEALKDLVAFDAKTSVKGAEGIFSAKIKQLVNAAQKRGLTLDEIDDVKNIYENTARLGYNKMLSPENVQRATNIDGALRNFIEEKATAQGFTNIKELNKNTQLSRFLAQAIEDKVAGQSSNNFLTLTDTIIGAGATIDPSALVVLAGKKIIGSEKAQAELAKKFARAVPKEIKAEISQSTPALLNPATIKREADFLVAPTGSAPGAFESATKKIATSGQKTNQGKSLVESQLLNPSLKETIPRVTKKASGKTIPEELLPVAKEARKYKSPEEFVNAMKKFDFKKILGEENFNKALAKITADMPEPTAAGTREYVIDLWYKANNKVRPQPKVVVPKKLAPDEFDPEDIPF